MTWSQIALLYLCEVCVRMISRLRAAYELPVKSIVVTQLLWQKYIPCFISWIFHEGCCFEQIFFSPRCWVCSFPYGRTLELAIFQLIKGDLSCLLLFRGCCVPSDVRSPLPSLLLKKVSHKTSKLWTLMIDAYQSPETWIAVRQWHIYS